MFCLQLRSSRELGRILLTIDLQLPKAICSISRRKMIKSTAIKRFVFTSMITGEL